MSLIPKRHFSFHISDNRKFKEALIEAFENRSSFLSKNARLNLNPTKYHGSVDIHFFFMRPDNPFIRFEIKQDKVELIVTQDLTVVLIAIGIPVFIAILLMGIFLSWIGSLILTVGFFFIFIINNELGFSYRMKKVKAVIEEIKACA